MAISPEFYMQLAIDAAWRYAFLTYPNPAVGCVVLDKHGALLSIAAHQKAGGPHAEVLALQEAYAKKSGDNAILALQKSDEIHDYLTQHHAGLLRGAKLYVTLEPCHKVGKTPACSRLLAEIGVAELFIGARDTTSMGGGAIFLASSGCRVTYDVLAQKAQALLEPFLAWQSGRTVVLYKWAQHQNGAYEGKIVSCETSRRHVHALRSVIDRLYIGGNTVRIDAPTLDARLVEGKVPNVTILSRQKVWAHEAPLWHVPHREVTVEENLSTLSSYGLVLVEGTQGLWEAFAPYVTYDLVYTTPHMRQGATIDAVRDGTYVASMAMGEDQFHIIKRKP
ncbi:MAG: hypothetical protein KU28_00240 [Sulfurovum sp. PC08-66]|nr:MAG: hypothetical protein KU28_00240 [Sulfurovum sp. PC08-66]KIM12399.1 MAG: hypothetical protein KU37_00360 [Sulfuricurvum sp. PC08-66]